MAEIDAARIETCIVDRLRRLGFRSEKLVKMGVKEADDGPYQFIPFAFRQFFQRWWEPATPGEGWKQGDPPYTGRFRDALGNPFTMMFCGNAKISMKEAVAAGFRANGRLIIDPDRTRSGYGLVVVDREKGTLRFEHWDRDLVEGRAVQFEGWPVEVPVTGASYER
jgi:hypothetical protein